MKLQPGIFIKSTDALKGSVFEEATILVAEHNADGALGFIIDKPFARTLNELQEFKLSTAFALYLGGPIDQEHLFFIHQQPHLIPDGNAIGNGVHLGGDFSEAVKNINNKSIGTDGIKIFVGYCGWDTNELEAEIKEGSWTIINNADPFTTHH